MSKKVVITIADRHEIDGEPEEAKLTTVGEYDRTLTGFVLRYDETEDFSGSVTTLTVDGSKVTMHRLGGKHNAQLIVEPGKRYSCMYATEYADLMLGVRGKDVRSRLNENGGELNFSYTLDFNTGFCSQNELNVTFRFE